ncbi:uncharacterized, partial [Tachysurus ichikawai]
MSERPVPGTVLHFQSTRKTRALRCRQVKDAVTETSHFHKAETEPAEIQKVQRHPGLLFILVSKAKRLGFMLEKQR